MVYIDEVYDIKVIFNNHFSVYKNKYTTLEY